MLFLACAKYAYLPAEIGLTFLLCSKADTSFNTAVNGEIVSPTLPNLYCALSENKSKDSLKATLSNKVLTSEPEAAISIGSVSKT